MGHDQSTQTRHGNSRQDQAHRYCPVVILNVKSLKYNNIHDVQDFGSLLTLKSLDKLAARMSEQITIFLKLFILK